MTKVFQSYLREEHNKTALPSENIFLQPLGRKLSTAFNAAIAHADGEPQGALLLTV